VTVPDVKSEVREIETDEAEALADSVVAVDTLAEVRELL